MPIIHVHGGVNSEETVVIFDAGPKVYPPPPLTEAERAARLQDAVEIHRVLRATLPCVTYDRLCTLLAAEAPQMPVSEQPTPERPEPCARCDGDGWRLRLYPDWVQKCPDCDAFDTDIDAAGAALLEVTHLTDADERGRLVHAVMGTCRRYLEG